VKYINVISKGDFVLEKLKFISLETLLELIENKEEFKLVDTLQKETFDAEHIPGAINLPLEKIRELAPQQLKKDEKIVLYCRDYPCHTSTTAAKILMQMGYTEVMDFRAGKRGWLEAGFELEQSPTQKEGLVEQKPLNSPKQ